MATRILGDLNVEKCNRQLCIQGVDVGAQYKRVIGHGGRIGGNQLRAQGMHFRIQRPKSNVAPVRQIAVIRMDAGERRIHRTPLVVMHKKTIENVAHRSSGMETHRRSRNDRSTALISSCTCAPSSKFPSFSGPSLRISVMKELTRLA